MHVTTDLTSADWRELAACADDDPNRFFSTDERDQQDALAICATCPVREPCLDHAMRHGERYGIWGGLRESERNQLARQRRRVA